jgi:hypothetical protein
VLGLLITLQHKSKLCQHADRGIHSGKAIILRLQSTDNIWNMILAIVDITNSLIAQDTLFFRGIRVKAQGLGSRAKT